MHQAFLTLGNAAASFSASEVVQASLSSAQTEVFSTMGVAVPIVAGVIAAGVAVKVGFKWLRKVGSA